MGMESGQAKASASGLGATVDEIMEVLKLGVIQGVQACGLGVTILAEELGHPATA